MTENTPALSIQQTSERTGLSASVLRIWEMRYGWPNPKRKANGYRSYQPHQVEELQRIAGLVKEGMPISSLIVDGLPRWPTAGASRPNQRQLVRARELPCPQKSDEASLFKELLDAIEHHRTPLVHQILQRIFWTVRPSDEPQTALVPALVALAELRQLNRPIPDGHQVQTVIKDRCIQLLRMQRTAEDAISVVPSRAGDEAFAALTTVMLSQRGIASKLWAHSGDPKGPFILVIDSEQVPPNRPAQVGVVSTLGGTGAVALADLLDATKSLPWSLTTSAR